MPPRSSINTNTNAGTKKNTTTTTATTKGGGVNAKPKPKANTNTNAKPYSKSQARTMSSSPPSSPGSWADNGQDLNKMLAETQRKIHEQHHKLAQKAMSDAKDLLADVMERINHAYTVTHKDELNAIAETLMTKLAVQDTLIESLYEEVAIVNAELHNIFDHALDELKQDFEAVTQVGLESGQGIKKIFNDEKKSLQTLELAVGADLHDDEPVPAATATTVNIADTTGHTPAGKDAESTKTSVIFDNGAGQEDVVKPRSRGRKSRVTV
ncbi:hypothetical protein IAT40_004435 [Kwoniella sp. CBS 6097]